MTDGLLELISVAVQKGKAKDIKVLVQQAIDEGVAAENILNDGLMAGMNIIGGKFKRDEVFVPEVLVAGRAMNTGTAMLKPLLALCLASASLATYAGQTLEGHPDDGLIATLSRSEPNSSLASWPT